MNACSATFSPPDVQFAATEINIVPAQGHEFRGAQSMPIGDQNGCGVPVTPTVLTGGIDKLLHLTLDQILPRSLNCYIC
jgi:hypothetical protein